MFDLSEKFTRVLTCTLMAGGGALAATLIPGIGGAMAGMAGGIASGILGNDLHADLLNRIRNQSDLLKNGDLAKVAANAAATVVRALAGDPSVDVTQGQRDQLRVLAGELEVRWERYITNSGWHAKLEGVTESDLPDFFRDVEHDVHQRRALTPEIWNELLRDVATQAKRGIDDKSLSLAATWLHDRFAQALWGVAKEESAGRGPTGGKGFAALHLTLLGQILDQCESLERQGSQTQEQLAQLTNIQRSATRGIVRLMRLHHAQIQAQFEALPQRLLDAICPQLDTPSDHQPNNLPYRSLGTLFKGREEFLGQLKEKLIDGETHAVGVLAAQTIHGLGGVGKTRAAVEFAWRHQEDFSALLFVTADSPENLQRNLAGLVGPLVLKLEEAQALKDQSAQMQAALHWLQTHERWFLILDNVDDEKTAKEVQRLVAQLTQGRILITSRVSKWNRGVETLELDVLAEEDARDFLLERTEPHRQLQPDDVDRATAIARDLDGLALALEQAGAYIAELGLSLAQYQQRWKQQRDKVLNWYDERVMEYPRSLAVTWKTSFEALTPAARTLLEHLCWLAPEPIPQFLFDDLGPPRIDPADEDIEEVWQELLGEDVLVAVGNLARYSLLKRDQAESVRTVVVHRLVQEITRRRLDAEQQSGRLGSTLRILDVADPGNPQDVRTWPRWNLLAPHYVAATQFADEQHIADPTARLMNNVAQLYDSKSLHSPAEPLMRRALEIDEASYGPEHPNVAIDLNNLAALLQGTNRLGEAEPLMRRALAIDAASYGPEHPNVARDLNNLAALLQDTNRLDEAEPLMRRVVTIVCQFTRQTGHRHPYLMAAMEVPETDRVQRLIEAGVDPAWLEG